MSYLRRTEEIRIVTSVEEVNLLLSLGNWELYKVLEGNQSIEFLMIHTEFEEEK